MQITVMGAGILGLSAAWEMARRGARVRVIEAVRVGAGASGGLVGALAPHVPEQWNAKKAVQLDSLLMAEDFWRAAALAGGVDPGYARLGRVQPLADEAAVALARVRAESARDLWQGRAEWRVSGPVPGLRLASATGLFVHDTLSARVAPRQGCAALVAALAARGVTVDRGREAPEGRVLWATGVQGLLDLGIGGPLKGQAALLSADWRAAPQVFVEGVHVVPHADGTVAVGSTSERGFDDPVATDGQIEALIERVRALCPDLADAPVIERWAGLRPRSANRAPVLGAWPGRPGWFVLNGGFKIGFGMAPKLAQMAADLVLEGEDSVPPGFRLDEALGKAG